MPPQFHQNNLHQLDPNWDFAQKHGLASKTGIINISVLPEKRSKHERNLCHCCNEHISKEQVDIWVHSKELEFLGLGFPLFYEFLKFCMIMLVISIGCYHSISLQLAYQENYDLCQSHASQSDSHRLLAIAQPHSNSRTLSSSYSSSYSSIHAIHCYSFLVELSRIQPEQNQLEQFIRITSFIIQMLMLIYIRNNLIKLQAYYDERSTTLSDYSMIIKGISKKEGIRKSILEFIYKQMGSDVPNVQEIILLPPLEELEALKQHRHHLINELRPHYSEEKNEEHEKFVELQKQLAVLNEKILVAAKSSHNRILEDKLECERVLVVFNTEQERINVMEVFKDISSQALAQYFGGEHKIRFEEAPEPEEIIWQNANVPTKKRILYVILGWLLSISVLAAVFMVFYFTLVQKAILLQHATQKLEENPEDNHYKRQYIGCIVLVYALMFLVILFDKLVLATLFHKFTDLEKHGTTADLQFSFALKYAIGLFFTTALMTLAVEALKFHNYMTYPYGVIDQESIMFFMNSFFIPFFWLVNPLRIWKIIKRKFNYGKKHLTQEEANKLMEEESYDLGKRFAEVIEMMWFVYLYSTLIPIGAVIIVAGLIFYYWVDKYNLLRRSKVQGKVSGSFIQTSLTMLDITLILRPLGSILFDYQIRDGSYMKSDEVMLCVAVVYLILPKNYFIGILNEEAFKPQEKQYKEVKYRFHRNYKTEHPLFSILSKDEIEKDNFIQNFHNTFNRRVIENIINIHQQRKQEDFSVDQEINLGGKQTSVGFLRIRKQQM